mmetsp:Transcript_15656/g.42184  ORF Transcript_15656/g.42184 Transcript_15656/m.42184 type:complete len:341 (+) Transcript_15656:62-1084(+)
MDLMDNSSSIDNSTGTLGLANGLCPSFALELKPGYLINSSQCLQNRKKTHDSNVVTCVEQDNHQGALTGFFMVNAGYGGASTAKLAGDRFYAVLQSQADFSSDDEFKMSGSVGDAVLSLQQEIYEHWRLTNKMEGTHSTAVLVRAGLAVCCNAGDGMAVICRSGGEVCALTQPAPRLEEVVQPSVAAYELEEEDEFILIGCPSLWAKLDVMQVTKLVRTTLHKYKDPKYAIKHLVQLAQKSGAPGNLSACLIILNAERALDENARDLPSVVLRLRNSRGGSQGTGSVGGRSQSSSVSSEVSSASKTKKAGLFSRARGASQGGKHVAPTAVTPRSAATAKR